MKNGLYAAEFQTPLGSGSGVVMLLNGVLQGGDTMMYYLGSYTIEGSSFKAEVKTGAHAHPPGMSSVFGRDQVTIDLSGTFAGDILTANGKAAEVPNVTFKVKLKLVAFSLDADALTGQVRRPSRSRDDASGHRDRHARGGGIAERQPFQATRGQKAEGLGFDRIGRPAERIGRFDGRRMKLLTQHPQHGEVTRAAAGDDPAFRRLRQQRNDLGNRSSGQGGQRGRAIGGRRIG
jgi:hypothetical protein